MVSAVIRVGDTIEIAEIRMFHGTHWRLATVVAVESDRFEAKLIKGDFGEPGVDHIWLQLSDKNRTWR